MENTTTTKPGDQVKRGRGRPRKNPASATATTKAGAKASLKPINSYFTSAAQSEITTVTKAPPPPQPQIQLTEQQQQQQQEKQNGMEKGSTEISEEPDVKKPEQKKRRKSAKDENEDYEYEEEEDEDIVDAAASDDEVDSSTEDMDEKKTLSKGKVKQRETPKKTKYIKIADRRNPDGTPVERAKKSLKIKNSLFTVAKRNEDVCKSYWEGDAVYKSFRPPTGDHIESVPREAAAKYFCSPLDTQPNLKVVYKTIAPDRTVSVPPIASERDSTRVGAEDVIVNAGGPIWAVDWCPMKYDGEHATQYIAAATKSPDIKEHTTNVQSPGCAALQIWSLEGLCGGSSPSAALELAILHDYGTVFELQWCPTGAYSSEPSEALPEGRLGLLAAATSSGFVVVWSVPLPSAAARVSTPFVRLDPVFRISIPGAVPTSIEWSLDQQHSSLLVGFSDGYTRAWAPEQCKRDGGGNTVDDYTPFFECFCAPLGVRSVRWSPLLSDVFAVAALSYLPELQIWSLQNPFSPLQSIIPPGSYIPRTIEWNSLNVILFGTDNGTTDQITPLTTTKMRFMRNHKSALWGMDTNPYTLQSASVGADGVVMLARTGQRRDHSRLIGTALAVLSDSKDDNNTVELRTDEKVVQLVDMSVLSDLDIPKSHSIYSVSWNKMKNSLKWIAFGGENGILFIHKIKTTENYIV